MDELERTDLSNDALELAGVLRDSLIGGVLAVGANLRLCSFNAEAERLTGLSASLLLGQSMEALPNRLVDLIEQTFATQAGTADQIDFTHPDGNSFVVRAATSVCRGPAGEVSVVIVVLNDLTAAHKLAGDMQRLDRLASIGTLSASMAHEIKNALVAVNTFLQDLTERNRDSELAGLVGREFRRVDLIVSQMLKFAGPAKPTFTRVGLHRILDQSLRLIQPQLETKQIRLVRSFAARPDKIDGDDYQLEQAFLNLLLNAVAAMDKAGQLSVSTELSGGPASSPTDRAVAPQWIQVLIGDTGTGIPPEQLGRLFEPFFTTKPHGTGLGLAITRRIILEHHGKVEVESEPRKGTTFRIALPLVSSDPKPNGA